MPGLKGIPNVRSLCRELFHAHGQRQRDLRQSITEWVSYDGTPGKDLRFWKPEYDDNYGLRQMARKFLEAGYGKKH